MPINFELDFVQPLLKDLETGQFKDVGDFATGVTKYYVQTIEKGAPFGIPPTLPAPAASGAPAPVGTGPNDAFKTPLNQASEQKFDRAVFVYFDTKEMLLQKDNLEQKKAALQGILRKAKYQKELISAGVRQIKTLSQKLEDLPANIKQLGDTAKEMVASYKTDLLAVVVEIKQIAASDIDPNITFKDTFPEEHAVIETLTNLEFKAGSPTEIKQTYNNILTVIQYLEKANRVTSNENETQRYIKQRLSAAAQKIVKIVTTIIEPDKFGDLLTQFISDKSRITEATERKVRQGRQAVEAIKIIKYIVEPQIRILEQKLKIQKENIKERIELELSRQKEVISKKISEIGKRKEKSERKKLFEKYVEDAKRLKAENQDNIVKAKKVIKLVTALTKDGTALLQASTKLKDDITKEFGSLKVEFEKIKERTSKDIKPITNINLSGSNTSGEMRSYLTAQGLKDLYEPLNQSIGSLTIDFIDIRKLLEKSETKYDQYDSKIFALQDRFVGIENSLREFKDLPKKPKPKRKRAPRKGRSRSTIISILKKLKLLLARVEAFIKKQLLRAEKFANEQIAKAKVIAKRVEIAVINSLPIPEQLKDVETRRAAIEEKKETIKQYKVKVQQTKQKIQAAAILGSNAVKVGTNLAAKDFSAAKNEQPLQKIASAKFQYFTVGVDPASPQYKKEEDDKNRFLKEIGVLKQIEQLVTIAILTLQGLKNTTPNKLAAGPQNFIEELKRDFERLSSIAQSQSGEISLTDAAGRANQKAINIIKSFAEAPVNDPKGLIATIKDIKVTVQGEMLQEVLKPVSFAPTLISLEQKYLQKVKKLLAQMVGVATPEDEEDKPTEDTSNEGLVASNYRKAQELKKRKKQAAKEKLGSSKMYVALQKMHKILNEGRGSFIIFLIEKISELVARIEAFVRIQINKVNEFVKKEIKGRLDKEKKQYQDRLQAILKKKLQNDLIPQTITYNIASLLFWTGASWTNTNGTIFQVITIPPFKKLTVDGRIKGTAAAVRELAQNFELQLTTLNGLCVPNPATGIPPFPFVGYK